MPLILAILAGGAMGRVYQLDGRGLTARTASARPESGASVTLSQDGWLRLGRYAAMRCAGATVFRGGATSVTHSCHTVATRLPPRSRPVMLVGARRRRGTGRHAHTRDAHWEMRR